MFCNNVCGDARFTPLTICKIDSVTGAGLAGAVFELTAENGFACTGTTNSAGALIFCVLPCQTYTLREISPPPGYIPHQQVYQVCVDTSGCLFVNGQLTSQLVIANRAVPPLVFTKLDAATGLPVAGAVFTLEQNGMTVATATSGANGLVHFGTLLPGLYALLEAVPPPGYRPNGRIYQVIVGTDGSITVDGLPLESFSVENIISIGFSFLKTSLVTGLPLAGAVFELQQNGTTVDTSVSDTAGLVFFTSLLPGSYQLVETVPPPGYVSNPAVYQVVVQNNGTVTIDGAPPELFTVANMA